MDKAWIGTAAADSLGIINVVEDHGAVGDGLTDDTAAINAAFGSIGTATGRSIYFPAGQYLVDQINIPDDSVGLHIFGAGSGNTVLKQKTNTQHTFAWSASAQLGWLTIEHMQFQGLGSGSGTKSAIYIPAAVNWAQNVRIQHILIQNYGGAGILDEHGMFSSQLTNVMIDDCGGHQFDLKGANTLTLINCYALDVPVTGKAGYRIRSGNPTLIGCNGINSGEYWGIFSSTVAADGVDAYCLPTLIGCNVEDFTVTGVLNRNAGMNIQGTLFTSASGSTTKAVDVTTQPVHFGMWAFSQASLGGGGAAWSNSTPIHSRGYSPFAAYYDILGAETYTYYDSGVPGAYTVSAERLDLISYLTRAPTFNQLYAKGPFRSHYSGTATLVAGTATVTLSPAMPSTAYMITLAGDANETFRWASKATGSFVINSSNVASTANVDWSVALKG